MLVSTLLQRKGADVATITPDARVADLLAQLARLGIGALVVSNDGAHIEGIVSERDVVRAMVTYRGDLSQEPVSTIMSTDVHTCAPDEDVDRLMAIMTERRIRHVPVIDGGRLAGIVSIGDVVKSRIDELERHRRDLEEYITAR